MSDTRPLIGSEDTEVEPGFRMVLLGKTGVGKSASANTILGATKFESKLSLVTVTSECQKETGEFEGETLALIDTPGLFDPNKKEEELEKQIIECISLTAPGPHVFLVVIQPTRFTKEEQEALKRIQQIFGQEASAYSLVLFTGGDNLEADGVYMEEFIHKSPALHRFISQCGGRYHVFNNRSRDPSQVRELLDKIRAMVQSNGGSFYTNKSLQEAERAIREKQERLLRENPNMLPREARRRAEKDNSFIRAVLATIGAVSAGAGVGAGIGVGIEFGVAASVGMVGGPVGAAAGAVVALTAAGIIAAVKRNKSNRQ